jgi:tRNA G18 (ribose-2'-O)-methylase SpoU
VQPIVIDDPADPRLADYLALNDVALRTATEERDGVFIAEGITVLHRLLTSPYRIRSLVLIPQKFSRLRDELTDRWPSDAPVYVATREVLAGVAGFDIHRGVIAAADRGPGVSIADLAGHGSRLLVAMEGLNDTENLGAIARTARAFGAGGLILDAGCADPLYRRSVRVSMGEVLHLPIARSTADAWPTAAMNELRAAGYVVAALTPAADAVSIYDWSVPERVVVLLGAEGPGLSTVAQRAADVRLRIPINPAVDSLNVGHATAAALAVLGRG